MSQIVLDMGSGNGNGNDIDHQKTAVDAVVGIDSKKHEVVFKYQLWDAAQGENDRLQWDTFDAVYYYAKSLGYQVTSSVFDKYALAYLLEHDVPFVKIANRPDLWWLMGEVPRKTPVYVSNYPVSCGFRESGIVTSLACVSRYPASLYEYELIPNLRQFMGISDHVAGLELWHRYHPSIWEKHLVLERGGDNLDGGPFAITPGELQEVVS